MSGYWGDGEFVERVIEEWDEVGRANLRLTGVRRSLSLLAQQVYENWGVTMEELRSGSRRQVVLKAREEFSQMAVEGLGGGGSTVPWGERLLCDENCVQAASVGRGQIKISSSLGTFRTNVPYFLFRKSGA